MKIVILVLCFMASLVNFANAAEQNNTLSLFDENKGNFREISVTISDNKKEFTKIIKFYENGKLLFKTETDALFTFKGILPLNGSIYTEWEYGTGYTHVYIFSIDGKKIKEILDIDSGTSPELVDIDNDGSAEIIVSDGKLLIDAKQNTVIQEPEYSRVYKLVNKQYIMIRKVKWKDRFKSESK